jgi:hypothetical protein
MRFYYSVHVMSKLSPLFLTLKQLNQIALLHVRHQVPQTYRTTGTQSFLKILNWMIGNNMLQSVSSWWYLCFVPLIRK